MSTPIGHTAAGLIREFDQQRAKAIATIQTEVDKPNYDVRVIRTALEIFRNMTESFRRDATFSLQRHTFDRRPNPAYYFYPKNSDLIIYLNGRTGKWTVTT